jgi:hypothetical protein
MQPKNKTTANFRLIFNSKSQVLAIIAYTVVCLWLYIANEGETTIIVCPSRLLYGLPCPGCGVTRATLMAFHGEVIEALAFNPNCLFAMAFILAFPIVIGVSIYKKEDYTTRICNMINNRIKNKFILASLLFAEACIWIHNIIRGM